MLITVGLARELFFIAKVTNITQTIIFDQIELKLSITPEAMMKVWYKNKFIWEEKIEGDESFFGIESADSIFKVIKAIDNGENWEIYSYFEK
jgi:hypothetical protein